MGLYPTSQITDFVVATALVELARRQKAAIGLQMTLSRLLAATQQHPNCSLDIVNHSEFKGLPGSIPTAPTKNLDDLVALAPLSGCSGATEVPAAGLSPNVVGLTQAAANPGVTTVAMR